MNRVGVREFSERRRQTRKSSLRDDCHHVIRHHRHCHGMINASVRCLFSLIEEGFVEGGCGIGGTIARAGECIYMYTETANKHSADLNNVSPNGILQRCDVVALLLAVRNLVRSKYWFTRHSCRQEKILTHCKNNIVRGSDVSRIIIDGMYSSRSLDRYRLEAIILHPCSIWRLKQVWRDYIARNNFASCQPIS